MSHETSLSVIFDYAQNSGVCCLPKKSFERSRTTPLVVIRKTCYRWRRRTGKLIAPNTLRRIPVLIDCRQTRTPAINNDRRRSVAIVQNVFSYPVLGDPCVAGCVFVNHTRLYAFAISRNVLLSTVLPKQIFFIEISSANSTSSVR